MKPKWIDLEPAFAEGWAPCRRQWSAPPLFSIPILPGRGRYKGFHPARHVLNGFP